MAKIELTPEELKSQAQEMAALQTEFESLFNGTSSLLTTINGNWSATLANNFDGKINSAQNAFRKVTEMLGKGSELAMVSANTYQSMDDLLAKATLQSVNRGTGAAAMSMSGSIASKAGDMQSGFWNYMKESTVESWKDAKNTIGYLEELYEQIPEMQRKLIEEVYKNIVPKDLQVAWSTAEDIITGDINWDTASRIGRFVTKDNVKAGVVARTFDYLHDIWNGYTSADAQAQELMTNGQFVNGLTQEVGVFTNYVIGGTVEILGKWGTDLIEKIPGVSFVEDMTGFDLGDKWDGAMENVHSGISHAFEYAGEKLQEGADYVVEGAQKIGHAVGEGISNIGSGIVGLFKKKR